MFCFENVVCANVFYAFLGALQYCFLQILPLPPRDQLVRPQHILTFAGYRYLITLNYTQQTAHGSRLPYSLSGVFSYQPLTLLIRVRYPQTYIPMESL